MAGVRQPITQVPEDLFESRTCGQHPQLIQFCREALKADDEIKLAALNEKKVATADHGGLSKKALALGAEISQFLTDIPDLPLQPDGRVGVGVTLGGALHARVSTYTDQPIVVKLIMDPLDIDTKQRTMASVKLSTSQREKVFSALYKFYPGKRKTEAPAGTLPKAPAPKKMNWAARAAAVAAPAPTSSSVAAAATSTAEEKKDEAADDDDNHDNDDEEDEEEEELTDMERWNADPDVAFEEGLWSALSLWDLFMVAQDNGFIRDAQVAEEKLLHLTNDIFDVVYAGSKTSVNEDKLRKALQDFVNYDLHIVLDPGDQSIERLLNLICRMQTDVFLKKDFSGVQVLVEKMDERMEKLRKAAGDIKEEDEDEEDDDDDDEEEEEALVESTAEADASAQPAVDDGWETVTSSRKGKKNKDKKK